MTGRDGFMEAMNRGIKFPRTQGLEILKFSRSLVNELSGNQCGKVLAAPW